MSARDLNSYTSVSDLIDRTSPDEPVFCYWPEAVRARASDFVSNFPGRTLYAVKCNPDPNMLRWLHEGGVRHFDTASRAEIALVRDLFPDAHCYFNHPVKSREALRFAYDLHGVRDFVVDHGGEFDKILEVLGSEVLIEVRLAVSNRGATYDFSTKFGAGHDVAAGLLKRTGQVGANAALSFHVGSHSLRPEAFVDAIAEAKAVFEAANVTVRYLNVGGGFPVDYDGQVPEIGQYFDAIRRGHAQLGKWSDLPLYCEPGRYLAAHGMAILVQVHLRRENALFINDGVFGSLSEVNVMKFEPPLIAYGRARVLRGEPVPFKIFGPTCDPQDELPVTFTLPDDIDEGDWILIERMGAYSNALTSDFNGFGGRTSVVIEGVPGMDLEAG